MIIVVDNKIVVLKNVKEIELNTYGNGTKKDPYNYLIRFHYFGGDFASISFDEESKAKETFEKIITILQKEE